jgi:NADPH2:quinone reductase
MRAAVVEAPGRASLRVQAIPRPRDGEVLIQVEGCGVCSSSLPVWEGRPWFEYPLPPGAPGHEGWGLEVESGRRVAFFSERSFAEYQAVPAAEVVALPPELDDVPVPGEALGCAMNIFARSGVRSGDTVAVVGAGFLGLLLVQLCVAARARTLVYSRRSGAVELARTLGAATPEEDASCDIVIEAGGVQETLDRAASLCRVGGRLVIAGYHQDGLRSVNMQDWNWRALELVNAHERDRAKVIDGIREAVAAVATGRLDPRPLLTHELPLERLDDAFELARTRPAGFVKALVVTR